MLLTTLPTSFIYSGSICDFDEISESLVARDLLDALVEFAVDIDFLDGVCGDGSPLPKSSADPLDISTRRYVDAVAFEFGGDNLIDFGCARSFQHGSRVGRMNCGLGSDLLIQDVELVPCAVR